MTSLSFLVSELQSLASETRRKHPEVKEAADKSIQSYTSSPSAFAVSLASPTPASSEILRPLLLALATRNAKVIGIALGTLQRLVSLRAVHADCIPLIAHGMRESTNQGVDIQLRILQILLGCVMGYKEIHGEDLGHILIICFKLQESRITVVSSTAAATLRQLVMFVAGDRVLEEDKAYQEYLSTKDTSLSVDPPQPPPTSLSPLPSPATSPIPSPKQSSQYNPWARKQIQLPSGTTVDLLPSASDAYFIFEDLCLLANSERAKFLRLDSLPKTFALELVESVLTNCHAVIRKHQEQLTLLSHHLCPFLIRSLSDRPALSFPLTLRAVRVLFLLLKQFSHELSAETEIFMMLLIRVVSSSTNSSSSASLSDAGSIDDDRERDRDEKKPVWLRVIALEIIRGLCGDAEFMRRVFERYDSTLHPDPSTSNGTGGTGYNSHPKSEVFGALVSALNRVSTEKPSALGVNKDICGVGVDAHGFFHTTNPYGGGSTGSSTTASLLGRDVSNLMANAAGGVVGMVGMAASGAASGMGMRGTTEEAGLSLQGSSMKLQCIDQLDKADAPPIPETYIYLLAFQSIVLLVDGFAGFVLPVYNSLVVQRRKAAATTQAPATPVSANMPGTPNSVSTEGTERNINIKAPPALTSQQISEHAQLHIVALMIDNSWHGFLAPLSFFIAANLSEELFADVVNACQNMTTVSGSLGLTTARDAFITALSKFAIPPAVVSALEAYVEPNAKAGKTTGGIAAGVGMIADNLGLGGSSSSSTTGGSASGVGGAGGPPGLSKRNLACLKSLISCALFLAGSLGPTWFQVFEALQNAEYVLFGKGYLGITRKGSLQSSTIAEQNEPLSSTSSTTGTGGGSASSVLFDLDSNSVQLNIQRLFDSSRNLEDEAFKDFIEALCKLSKEMIEMQIDGQQGQYVDLDGPTSPAPGASMLSPDAVSPVGGGGESLHRRRASGIHLPKSPRAGDFALNKLNGICILNIYRLIYRAPTIAWTPFTEHCLNIIVSQKLPSAVRLQAANTLDNVLVGLPKNMASSAAPDLQKENQTRLFGVLARQNQVEAFHATSSTTIEIRRLGLEALLQILQASVHTIVTGWEVIFGILSSVCSQPSLVKKKAANGDVGGTLGKGRPPPIQANVDKGNPLLIRIAFQSLTLICDSLATLGPGQLRLCIRTLGLFGRQADTNVALTSATSLLWGVSDAIQTLRKGGQKEEELASLWMALLTELFGLCTDSRPEVRVGSIQTLFRSLQLYGETMTESTWRACIWEIFYPLLATLSESIAASDKEHRIEWDESKTLTYSSIAMVMEDFFHSKLVKLPDFEKVWNSLVAHVEQTFATDNNIVIVAALKALDKALQAASKNPSSYGTWGSVVVERTWTSIVRMGASLKSRAIEADDRPYTQESLLAFMEAITTLKRLSANSPSNIWDLERVTALMAILKSTITFSKSPSYRPDIDYLTPLQSAAVEIVKGIDTSDVNICVVVLADIAEYSTLAFLAAFDIPTSSSTSSRQGSQRRMLTYIALSKVAMPLLLQRFSSSSDNLALYLSGTIERVLSAYGVPLKLKYDCPAPSKTGNDPPLWKTAATCFLTTVLLVLENVVKLADRIPVEQLTAIWHQIVEIFQGALLADCSSVEGLPLEEQEAEEIFDRNLLITLEREVVPRIGSHYVPDHVVMQMARMLQRASHISMEPEDYEIRRGTTGDFPVVPRERFSYWCFELLFKICGHGQPEDKTVTAASEVDLKRVAALSLPSMVSRCRTVLANFVADQELRGSLPFPRAREEELVFCLRNLLDLELWPGSLWAAYSSSPSAYLVEQPAPDLNLQTADLLADISKRGPKAHLFQFYPLLLKIATAKGPDAKAWVPGLTASRVPITPTPRPKKGAGAPISPNPESVSPLATPDAEAKSLALQCLEEIGRQMSLHS